MSVTSPVRVPIIGGGPDVGGSDKPSEPSSPPPAPSRCSTEFAVVVIPLLCIVAYGTFVPMRASYLAYDTYKSDLDKPDPILRTITGGLARGYDVEGDAQWRTYAHFTPLFVALFGAVGIGSRLLRALQYRHGPTRAPRRTSASFVGRTLGRWWSLPLFHAIVGLVFSAVLHGPHFVFLVFAALMNYVVFRGLQRRVPYWAFALIMWTSHVGFLYVAEACQGFEYSYWVQYWLPSSRRAVREVLPVALHDRAVPLWSTIMRWQQLLRMATLRMIAFDYDLWESSHEQRGARHRAMTKHREVCVDCAALRQRHGARQPSPSTSLSRRGSGIRRGGGGGSGSSSGERERRVAATPLVAEDVAACQESSCAQPHDDRTGWDESLCCHKFRTEYARDLEDYNLANYLAFVFFAPLYLAGPMMSFNAFVSYLKHPTRSMPLKEMARYVVRIVVVFLLAYTLLHLMYVHSITADLVHFKTLPIQAQGLLLYWYLAYLWLKFAFLWRTSRLYAVWSGIEPPEDMRRCFSDTLTIQEFWRDWHASFNLWIVRYMYIPMGGRASIARSLWPILFFIAIWHDHRLHLIQWAVLIVISFLVELSSHMVANRFLVKPVAHALAFLEAPSHSGNGRPSPRWALRVAHIVAQWSPSTRQTVWRALRGVAGALTILSLIAINLIGFLVQAQRTATAPPGQLVVDEAHSRTDRTVAEILFTRQHATFAACVVLVMVDVGVHNVFYRDRRACREAAVRRSLQAAGQLSA